MSAAAVNIQEIGEDVLVGNPPSSPPDSAGGARAELAADSSTFAPAMALLPSRARADVGALYRVLRTLDDLVDEDDPRACARVRAVEQWAGGAGGAQMEPTGQTPGGTPGEGRCAPDGAGTGQMEPTGQTPGGTPGEGRCAPDGAGGAPDTPETRTLADLASRHPLPRGSLLEFCAGMRHDIAREDVDSEEDFMRYCQQAGGSVGVVLASILGGECPEAQTGMAVLGRAMQVTNILRDIDEDRAHGRLYISRAAIERYGFPSPGARQALLREHIARADALYEEGMRAIPLLREGRRAMALASALYREILREIERTGYGHAPGRVVVAPWRRRLIAMRVRQSTSRERGQG